MKKKFMFAVATVAVSVAAFVGMSSFVSECNSVSHSDFISHADCQGKHCIYTYGCDCSDLAPITGGEEWQKIAVDVAIILVIRTDDSYRCHTIKYISRGLVVKPLMMQL